jgi:hypothetical protein
MPCFAVEAVELRSGGKQCQGACKSGMFTGRSTVPSVAEHGGVRSTSQPP